MSDLPPPFVSFPHAVPPEELARIRALGAAAPREPGGREARLDDPTLAAWLWRTALLTNENFFRFDLDAMGPIAFVRHGPSDLRADRAPGAERPRKLGFTLQLSAPEEYAGGALEIKTVGPENVLVPREAGTLIAFPAWALHRVMPVTSGERLALVAWACGPAFR